MEPIILASGSLRRQDFFRLMGLPFSIMPSRSDEHLIPGLNPQAQAESIAKRKVDEVVKNMEGRLPFWIVGADTLISVDGTVFGKPSDKDDARRMLKIFSGREHDVVTGVALYNGRTKQIDCRSNVSKVRFASISDAELDWYLDAGEWQGVAGAYRIQGLASCFITGLTGSYSSVVGLPIHDFYVMLRENGYPYGA